MTIITNNTLPLLFWSYYSQYDPPSDITSVLHCIYVTECEKKTTREIFFLFSVSSDIFSESFVEADVSTKPPFVSLPYTSVECPGNREGVKEVKKTFCILTVWTLLFLSFYLESIPNCGVEQRRLLPDSVPI